jgi:hypothetical protein
MGIPIRKMAPLFYLRGEGAQNQTMIGQLDLDDLALRNIRQTHTPD